MSITALELGSCPNHTQIQISLWVRRDEIHCYILGQEMFINYLQRLLTRYNSPYSTQHLDELSVNKY